MSQAYSHAQGRSSSRAQPTRVIGEIILTVGVLILLFAFYEAFWTNVASGKLQDQAQSQLEDKWDSQRENPRSQRTPGLGEAFAQMYIPAFGADFVFAIVEGTEEEPLLIGPGRYETTQMPGERGNFAVAGHRVGKGAPFNDLGKLRECDAIVVETATEWVTYRVLPMGTNPAERESAAQGCLSPKQAQRVAHGDYSQVPGRQITVPGNTTVINPMPGAESVEVRDGLEGVITLTTCHPQFSNAERMIIHAMQTDSRPKSEGLPEAFKETV